MATDVLTACAEAILTLKMASAQVVETSVINNSPSQDSRHPDDLFKKIITDDNTGIFHAFELRLGMNEFDHRSFILLLKQQRERLEKFRPFSLLLKQRYKTAMIKFIKKIFFLQ